MVSQLERSATGSSWLKCVRQLSTFFNLHDSKSSEKMMFKQYLTAVKVTLGHAVEEMTVKVTPALD